MMVANATGCSSIYGGNLPVTPWSKNGEGRGPAWSNSLFEDNAEFGLGFRLAADKHLELATTLARGLAPKLGAELVEAILTAPQVHESEIRAQRARVATLIERLRALGDDPGGEGPAVGRRSSGAPQHLDRRRRRLGLRHRLWRAGPRAGDRRATSTCWCWTPRSIPTPAARRRRRRRLARSPSSPPPASASRARTWRLQAIAYGNVYVAQVAMGANPQQTLLAFREAEAYPGPSLILAYCHCIAHGIDMQFGMKQQDLAVASGYWPLFRYNPAMREVGENPFRLDSPRPTLKFRDYAYNEIRYRSLAQTRPEEAEQLLAAAQAGIVEKYRLYEEMAGWEPTRFRDARAGAGLIGAPTMDLATTYLGLHPEAPADRLVIAADRRARQSAPARRRRRRGGRSAVDLRGADRERGGGVRAADRDRDRQLSRGVVLFPAQRQLRGRAAPLSRTDPPRARSARHSGHRQPERHHAAPAGPSTPSRSSRPAPARSSSTSSSFRWTRRWTAARSSSAISTCCAR